MFQCSNLPDEFYIACLDGDIKLVKKYLEQGISMDPAISSNIDTIFEETLDEFKFDVLKLLLDNGFGDYPDNRKVFDSLLYYSITNEVEQFEEFGIGNNRDIQRTAFLIGQGADVNWLHRDGYSLLDYALENHPEAAQLLRQAGAKKSSEMTPEEKILCHDFSYICRYNSLDDVKFYLAHKQVSEDELYLGFSVCTSLDVTHKTMPQIDIADYLISLGLDISKRGEYLKYKIKIEAEHVELKKRNNYQVEPDLSIFKYLLSRGANPNKPSSRSTALDIAIKYKVQPIIDLLRSYGAKTWVEMGEAGELPESEMTYWGHYLNGH